MARASLVIDAHDGLRVAADLSLAAATIQVKVARVVRHNGQLLQTRVKANASRPRRAPTGPGAGGPRIQTGDYNRSITLEIYYGVADLSAIVGTVAPQARRLEYGFVGTDSLGRKYSQPPYPHFQPAAAKTGPQFLMDLVKASKLPGERLTLGGPF